VIKKTKMPICNRVSPHQSCKSGRALRAGFGFGPNFEKRFEPKSKPKCGNY